MDMNKIADDAIARIESLSEEELEKLFISCGYKPVKIKEDYKRSCPKCGSFDFVCSYYIQNTEFNAKVADEADIQLILDNIEGDVDDKNKIIICCKNCGEVMHTFMSPSDGFREAIEAFFYD